MLLSAEVACLRPLVERFPGPYLETGVGTGRFAQTLGIEYGVDPSIRVLEKARRRGITAEVGDVEAIPFGDATFGAVLMAFTLCFVKNPLKAISEAQSIGTWQSGGFARMPSP